MKTNKALYVLAIIMLFSLMLVHYIQSKSAKSITTTDIIETSAVIEKVKEQSDIETADSSQPAVSQSASDTISDEHNHVIEEGHSYAKVTQEQVVQISANAFVSFFFTNKEEDRVLLKEYSSPEIYEEIINDNTATNQRDIQFVSLKDLSKNDGVFSLEYLVQYEENSQIGESTIVLTMVENDKDWIVTEYEIIKE